MICKMLFGTLLLVATFSSCNDTSKTGVMHKNLPEKSTVFKVMVDAIVPQNDSFSLYFTTDGSINFTKIPAIWVTVKGNSKVQQVTFKLPNNTIPSQMRIDLGSNPNQEEIILKWVRMSYNGKAVEIPGTLIFSYFRADLTRTTANPTTGQINGIVENGIRQTPSLYPKEGPLRKQIDYLLE